MWYQYLLFVLAGLLPIGATCLFYFLYRRTKFKTLKPWVRYIIVGVTFGILSIVGSECGVKINGAIINVRDAAPIVAGLIFSGPAGIIAGVIGGVERFIAPYWNSSLMYSQIACSVSTILSGLYAAALRKWVFENKRPSWAFGVATGVVMEVVHMVVLFITKINDPLNAMAVVKKASVPMIIANSVSIGLSCLVLQLFHLKRGTEKLRYRKISTQIQIWLLAVIVTGFGLSTLFVYGIETNTAYQNANKTLDSNITAVNNVVLENVKTSLGGILYYINKDYSDDPTISLAKVASFYEVDEVCVIKDHIIKDANISSYIGNDMRLVEQSREFDEKILELNVGECFFQEFRQQSFGDKSFKKYCGLLTKKTDDHSEYIQIGLNDATYTGFIKDNVQVLSKYLTVGETGFAVILDRNGNVLSHKGNDGIGLTVELLKKQSANARFEATVYGEKCFNMVSKQETFYVVVCLPQSEAFAARDNDLYINSFMTVIVFAGAFIVIFQLVKIKVVKKIEKVNASLGKIIKGDLSVKVDIGSSVEFESLSNDINKTVDTLKQYIAEAEQRIDQELAFAKTIQSSSLPSTFPAFPDRQEFDIYASMDTAKEVGGDFYDFYIVDRTKLVFLIADVSGKGIPAAMFMMQSKALLKNFAKQLLSADEIMNNVNDSLCQDNKANMFVTCWLGILDMSTGHVTFANAGHNNPLVYRKGVGYQYIEQKKNLVLGASEGIPYRLQEIDLQPGDRIYMYTDGVTEATRGDKVLYGEERLARYLNNHANDSLSDTLAGVKSDIDLFIDGADQFDDITMVILEYKGK